MTEERWYMAKRYLHSMKRPPRSVMVCGHRIKIKVVDELFDGSLDLYGAYNGDTKTIFLVKHHDWKSTLLHEMIHCVLHLTGAGEGIAMSKEEAICISLENALGHFFF